MGPIIYNIYRDLLAAAQQKCRLLPKTTKKD